MKLFLLILAAVAAALWLWRRYYYGDAGTVFMADDAQLAVAKAEARASLPQFWAALERGDPADSEFALKFNLNHGTDAADRESIWAVDVARRGGRIFGTLGNDPVNPAWRIGDEVEIAPEAIDDWSYFRGDIAQGHFVTRLMLQTASPGVAKAQKQALGWG